MYSSKACECTLTTIDKHASTTHTLSLTSQRVSLRTMPDIVLPNMMPPKERFINKAWHDIEVRAVWRSRASGLD